MKQHHTLIGRSTFSSRLETMSRQPFGKLEDGTVVEEIKSNLIITAIEYMKFKIRESTEEEFPPNLSKSQRQYLTDFAVSDAVGSLVLMLNKAIPDERYHVTSAYLLDEGHNYTTEFWLFVIDYCRVISGDPDFYANQGGVGFPPIIRALFRPLTAKAVYQILPQIVTKFVDAKITMEEVTSTSTIMRWYGHRQEDPILNEIHLTISSETWKSVLSQIPTLYGQPEAEVKETTSMLLDAADYYEWEFTWKNPPQSFNYWLALGIALSIVAVFVIITLNVPPYLLFIPAILFPLYFGWSLKRFSQLDHDHVVRERLLVEQQKLAEDQYDESHSTKARIQNLNIEMRDKIDELTALHEIGEALSATLNLDDLLERSLQAVIANLHFDRAMVMIVDYEKRILTRAKGVGDSSEIVERVNMLEFSLDDKDNHLITILNADAPILLTEMNEEASETNRQLFTLFQTKGYLGTPLIAKGRPIGILAVDNNSSNRPITEKDETLIFTVAGQIAVAIENALLYQEVESQKKTLEQRVDQRTEELAQAVNDAEEARTLAEDANEAKSTFLSSVSHELRTPLTSVLGFAKVIQRGLERHIFPGVDEDNKKAMRAKTNIREDIEVIIMEGQRLTNLINEVLDLAKIESGQLQWKEQLFDVVEVINRSVKSTTSLSDQKKLEILVESPDTPMMFTGDQDRLMQVVINLLSNAIKFTDKGQIRCKASQVDGEIVVSVSDTGIGIAKDDIPKVFEKFQQVGDTLTDKPSGTGLGLPISKEIVEHHGGRMWAESETGKGSTFSFALPLE